MAESQESDKARRVVFLKLQRIGGTTLAASILYPYCVKYGLQYMVPDRWHTAHPRLVPGNKFHMMFRHLPEYPQPWVKNWLRSVIGDYQLITILRDPVDRALSGMNHMAHHFGVKTIDEYLQFHHEVNHQSHWLGYDGRNDNFLASNFSGVGITERMNESLLLFRRTLNMNLEDMLYTSVYSNQPKAFKKSDLSDKHIDYIMNTDWLDVELYQQAAKLVDMRVACIPKLKEELREFEKALADFSHPLWGKRGPFSVGFQPENTWYEFTGQHGTVKQIRDVPP